MRETVVIADLAQRVASGPVAEAGRPGAWRWAPYETKEVKGTLLGCSETAAPEPVTIRLGVRGCWRVWLGLAVFNDVQRLRVRLSGDRCCRSFETPPSDYHHAVVHEMHFKDAELTGQDLVLECFQRPEPKSGALAWVRLEPLEKLPAAARPEAAHPLAMTEDAYGLMWHPHERADDLVEDYECLPPDTALRIMLWNAVCGDICTYPTKQGQYGWPLRPEGGHARLGELVMERNYDLWQKNGWDAAQVARDYCRGRGWEFHLGIRIQTFFESYPDDEMGSRFFREHPECWCRDAQGRAITRMSYAHPAVRERFLGIIDELVKYGPDGVNLMLIRGLPLVLYEPVMVEGFQSRHGVDPRTLDEKDERWLDYQAEVITGLMRETKARLKPGMRFSAIVPGRPDDLRRWGLDVRTWVSEGLVNDLYPMGQSFTDHEVHRDDPEKLDYAWFDGLPGRQAIRLIPTVYPWRTFRDARPRWKSIVRKFLDSGADGYCVWDGAQHEWWEYIDLGLDKPPARERPEPRSYPLTMVGGFRVDRYHPIEPF
jgi:hypothetical protein